MCGAKYHPTCRKLYMTNADNWRSSNDNQTENQKQLKQAHKTAFDEVCQVINKQILDKERVLKMSELCLVYVRALERTSYPNSQFRSENLKLKLEKKFVGKLCFIKMKCISNFQSHLIYSSSIDISKAIESAYMLGNADNITNVGNYLRNNILDAFSSKESLQ